MPTITAVGFLDSCRLIPTGNLLLSLSQTVKRKHWCGTRAIIASNAAPVLVFKFLVGFSQLTAKFTQSAIMEKSREFGMRTFD